jgi:hypothetical protein
MVNRTTIYKGDDTNAFGQNFIKIDLVGSEGYTISKCIFQCGPIQKVYIKPQFPIYVNFSKMESKRLNQLSECYLQVFDEKGLRQTCKGTLTFIAQPQVVSDEPRKSELRTSYNS